MCRPMNVRGAWIALGLASLLAADVVFIVINLISVDADGQRNIPSLLYVGAEWSVPEIIQYAKFALLAGILGFGFYLSRQPVYAVWAAAFAAMSVDDALDVHVSIGRILRRVLLPSERVYGLWELVPMALAVAVVLGALWYVHRRPGVSSSARRYTRRVLPLGILYGVFAVGVDAMHSLYNVLIAGDGLGDTLFQLLEDSGELVTATLILAYTVWHFHLRGDRQSDTRPRTAAS